MQRLTLLFSHEISFDIMVYHFLFILISLVLSICGIIFMSAFAKLLFTVITPPTIE